MQFNKEQVLAENNKFFPDGFKLTSLSHENYEETVKVVSLCFVTNEPLTRGNVTLEEYSKFARLMLRDVLNDQTASNVSFLLLDPSGKICSFMIANDLETDDSEDVKQVVLTPGLKPIRCIFHLLGQLQNSFRQNHTVTPGEYCHFFMGGTAEGYEGKGIGTSIRRVALNLAKSAGFKGYVVEATNPITRKMWTEKFGGKLIASIDPCVELNDEYRPAFDSVKGTGYFAALISNRFD